jgi:hypothetical protein
MIRSPKRLGDILIEKGLITQEVLDDALREQRETKEFLGAILLRKKRIKEADLLTALSEQFHIPLFSLKDKYIDWNLVKGFSASLILDYRCFPVAKDDWSITMAITNPLDIRVLKRVEDEAKGLRLKLVLVSEGDINDSIKRYNSYLRGNISKLFE